MSADTELLVVDRFEGATAVLVVDSSEEVVAVGRGALPRGCREGAVLRVPRDAEGGWAWGEAVVDEEATRERRAEAGRVLDELRRRDPGGDVAL